MIMLFINFFYNLYLFYFSGVRLKKIKNLKLILLSSVLRFRASTSLFRDRYYPLTTIRGTDGSFRYDSMSSACTSTEIVRLPLIQRAIDARGLRAKL